MPSFRPSKGLVADVFLHGDLEHLKGNFRGKAIKYQRMRLVVLRSVKDEVVALRADESRE